MYFLAIRLPCMEHRLPILLQPQQLSRIASEVAGSRSQWVNRHDRRWEHFGSFSGTLDPL